MSKGFIAGFVAPFTAIGFLLRRPQLWGYVLAPLILNALLVAGILYYGYIRIYQPLTEGQSGLQGVAIALGLVLLLLLAGGFLFIILAGILGAPFYDFMAERIEREYFRNRPELLAPGMTLLEGIVHSVKDALKRWGLALLFLGLAFLLNFVPLAGSILAAVAGLVTGGFFLVLDAFSYPLDRRRVLLRGKMTYIRQHREASLGLAVGLLLVYAFACTWLFAPPLSAIAGTRIYCEKAALR
jgi:CysZ protein